MFNPEKKIGASLLVLGMMISGRAMAQAETTPTCVKDSAMTKLLPTAANWPNFAAPLTRISIFVLPIPTKTVKNWRKSAISYMLTQFQQNRFRAVFRSVSFMTSAAR